MVKTGLEVLLAEHLDELKGKRIGIVANHAAVTSDLEHITDALHKAGVKIGALYGPEHGVRGDVADGEPVSDAKDERLGVPVFSLYGKTNKPTPEMLECIDIMFVDVQDVGARFYTFPYTMAKVMAACGENDKPVWVLDRPNPITGLSPEGNILDPEFSSFVGMYALPIRHGFTIGELATVFSKWFGVHCDLKVIKMQGWKRDMWFEQTGQPWVFPSPNMPTVDTAVLYPGTCFLEGTNVSEGRGTVRPFEMFGAPWVKALELHEMLMSYKLPAVKFREAYFIPSASKCKGEHCAGVQVYVTDRNAFKPVMTGVAIISALKKLHPDDFAYRPPSSTGKRFFDLLGGGTSIRDAIEVGKTPQEIAASWQADLASFQSEAKAVMLY